jgi:hypothetical protein
MCMQREAPKHLTGKQLGRACFVELVGGDYAKHYAHDRPQSLSIDDLSRLAIVFARGSHTDAMFEDAMPTAVRGVRIMAPAVLLVEFDFPVSSTAIRNELLSGAEEVDGVHPRVLNYIRKTPDLYLSEQELKRP